MWEFPEGECHKLLKSIMSLCWPHLINVASPAAAFAWLLSLVKTLHLYFCKELKWNLRDLQTERVWHFLMSLLFILLETLSPWYLVHRKNRHEGRELSLGMIKSSGWPLLTAVIKIVKLIVIKESSKSVEMVFWEEKYF